MNICVSRSPTYNLNKFIQEQVDLLLKNPKMHELIERISFQKEISKEQALRIVMDTLARQISGSSKPKMSIVR